MQIREIINILEEYENKSEHGSDTEVDFLIHPVVWTANYGYVDAKIEDVMISYGETDRVSFEMSLDEAAIVKLLNIKERHDNLGSI